MIDYLPMEARHLEGLVKVEEECFNSGYGRSTFQKELENKIAIYLVAEECGKVLGYAGLWNICGCADIMNVGVLKDCRRMGIGAELLRRLEDCCTKEEIDEINLEVRVSNNPARSLYRKMGYEEIDIRKGYYDGKEDAVIMKKILKKENG